MFDKNFKCPNCGSNDVKVKNIAENITDEIIEDYKVECCYECQYPYHEGE